MEVLERSLERLSAIGLLGSFSRRETDFFIRLIQPCPLRTPFCSSACTVVFWEKIGSGRRRISHGQNLDKNQSLLKWSMAWRGQSWREPTEWFDWFFIWTENGSGWFAFCRWKSILDLFAIAEQKNGLGTETYVLARETYARHVVSEWRCGKRSSKTSLGDFPARAAYYPWEAKKASSPLLFWQKSRKPSSGCAGRTKTN